VCVSLWVWVWVCWVCWVCWVLVPVTLDAHSLTLAHTHSLSLSPLSRSLSLSLSFSLSLSLIGTSEDLESVARVNDRYTSGISCCSSLLTRIVELSLLARIVGLF